MKRRSKDLWVMGASQLLSLSEKGIEKLLVKAEKTTDILLEKLTQKSKKQVKEKIVKRELLKKIEQRDAEITTANYLLEKSEKPNRTKSRLRGLEKDICIDQPEHEQL